MSEVNFLNGFMVKAPHERAPDFVKCQIAMKREDVIKALQEMPEGCDWVNLDVKVSKEGKWYASINDWKPKEKGSAPQSNGATASNDFDDDIPFAPRKD